MNTSPKEKEVIDGKSRINITPKEFKQLSKWAENVYNTVVVIDILLQTNWELKDVTISLQS